MGRRADQTRENQLLEMAAQGLTDREMAKRLGISQETVGTYWQRVLKRLSAATRTQAVARTLTPELQEAEQSTKTARLELRQLQAVLGCLPEAVIVMDGEGNLELANRAASRRWGIKRGEMWTYNKAFFTMSLESVDPAGYQEILRRRFARGEHATDVLFTPSGGVIECRCIPLAQSHIAFVVGPLHFTSGSS